ncbi:MAG: NHLP leader peptide family RiPP precursor [Holophaga sp.]|jgi:hypothetical protein
MSRSDQSIAEFIIRRAIEDPAFRRSLLASPRKAIEAALGLPLPKGVKVRIHEDTPDKVHLVLPPTEAPMPVPDAELQAIAAAGLAPGTCGAADMPGSVAFFNAPGSCAHRQI